MRKKVLITVVTYPLPSRSYDELVCTAGVLEDGTWIRIYPVRFKFLTDAKSKGGFEQYKYTWIELDLRRRRDDFRPESHSPINYDFSDMEILDEIKPDKYWKERKKYCLKTVYTNLTKLIEDSKAPRNISLATFKPSEIKEFIIEEDEREWKQEWRDQLKQLALDFGGEEKSKKRTLIPKLPYKFYYRFIDDNGKVSRMMIEDWEIGQLYWNCLKRAGGDEGEALEKVREKYWNEFIQGDRDIHLFLGTTMQWHKRRANNPFVIIGVFYPKRDHQFSLF